MSSDAVVLLSSNLSLFYDFLHISKQIIFLFLWHVKFDSYLGLFEEVVHIPLWLGDVPSAKPPQRDDVQCGKDCCAFDFWNLLIQQGHRPP